MITSSTRYHAQIRQSSWPVPPVTESTRDLASVIHWRPGYSARNIVCDTYLTIACPILILFSVTELLPSAEEAVADIRVWTVHSDTNALAISAYSAPMQTVSMC